MEHDIPYTSICAYLWPIGRRQSLRKRRQTFFFIWLGSFIVGRFIYSFRVGWQQGVTYYVVYYIFFGCGLEIRIYILLLGKVSGFKANDVLLGYLAHLYFFNYI